MPSPGDSISMAALSVSMTKSGSPLLTCSPSFLSHSTKVPVSMTISTLGMMTSVAMSICLPAPAHALHGRCPPPEALRLVRACGYMGWEHRVRPGGESEHRDSQRLHSGQLQ